MANGFTLMRWRSFLGLPLTNTPPHRRTWPTLEGKVAKRAPCSQQYPGWNVAEVVANEHPNMKMNSAKSIDERNWLFTMDRILWHQWQIEPSFAFCEGNLWSHGAWTPIMICTNQWVMEANYFKLIVMGVLNGTFWYILALIPLYPAPPQLSHILSSTFRPQAQWCPWSKRGRCMFHKGFNIIWNDGMHLNQFCIFLYLENSCNISSISYPRWGDVLYHLKLTYMYLKNTSKIGPSPMGIQLSWLNQIYRNSSAAWKTMTDRVSQWAIGGVKKLQTFGKPKCPQILAVP